MSLYRICSKRFSLNKLNELVNHKTTPLVISQKAGIIGLERKDPDIDALKPKPWPYLTKRYWWHHFWLGLDYGTPERLDCNSKVIILEGNKGSGKEELAQKLAKEFGMKYFPEVDLESHYVNHKGFDYRSLNKWVEPLLHAVDEKMFYENPYQKGVYWMKMFFYNQRYLQYIDALAHLYNTGQGIILERSPYSDFVFTEAMHKCGFLPSDVRDYYYRVRHASIYNLQRPHLIIYLDVPVEECLKRIKERNIPHEVNSKVLSKEYLQEIEDQYKNRYLPELGRHAEILMYDWTNYGDVEDVVEDIERLVMDDWDPLMDKFEDWNFWDQEHWEKHRILFTNKKGYLFQKTSNIPIYDVDSFDIDHEHFIHRDKIYNNFVPYYKTSPSFDPDTNSWLSLLFRARHQNYREENDFDCRHPFF